MDTFVRIAGLLIGCPFDKINKNCPFYELRNMTGLEKLTYLRTRSDMELKGLESAHFDCANSNDNSVKSITG